MMCDLKRRKQFSALLVLSVLLVLQCGCSANSASSSKLPISSSSIVSSAPDSTSSVADAADFLTKAHAMGYNDEKIEYMKSCGFDEQQFFTVESLPNNNLPELYTDDGKYKLSGFWVFGGDGMGTAYLYVKEVSTNKVSILPDVRWDSTQYGLLDDKQMYVAIVPAGGSSDVAGVKVYNLDNTNEPTAVWRLNDDAASNETERVPSDTMAVPARKRLVTFWYNMPSNWDEPTPSDLAATYKATVLNYDCTVYKEIDLQIPIQFSKYGIMAPCRSIKSPSSADGLLVFDFNGHDYTLDEETGRVTMIS